VAITGTDSALYVDNPPLRGRGTLQAMVSQEKIWRFFQNSATEAFAGADARQNYILNRIQATSKARVPRVLNIGAGSGYLEERVLARGWESHSLDPDDSTVKRLVAKGVSARVGRIEKMPFADDMFDVVVVSEVLEHLSEEELSTGLSEIGRVLKRGGTVLGTVPHRENLSEQMVVCPHCGQVFHRWGHQRSFDEESLASRLSPLFRVELLKSKYFGSWKRLDWKGKLRAIAKWVLLAMQVHGCDETLVFLGKKI